MADAPRSNRHVPCVATASMFLYAQGSSVVCCHHDTLEIQRIFSEHACEVQLLAVDKPTCPYGGRFVMTNDVSGTVIVWDLMEGHVISKRSYDLRLTAAAWMDGDVVFGMLSARQDQNGV